MSQTVLDQLEQSKQRVERANIRRNRIQVQLEAARQQYAEAVREAEAGHGTADLDKLRTILVDLEAKNTAAVAEFVRAVDDYEAFISRIEGALADPEVMAAVLATMAPVIAPAATPAPAATKPAPAPVAFAEEDI
jgi:membrane protein involved in colicin uptake